jgi:membrane-associated protein
VNELVDRLLAVPGPVAYALIGVLVFAEAAVLVGFVLPGETAVLLGGVLAATGRLSLTVLLILVVVAAIVGDTVGYEIGRHLGPRVLTLRPLHRHQRRIEGAQRFLRDRGGWAVFLARFTAFLRAVMPGLAGTSRMPYLRFLTFNAAGAIIWGVGVTLLGFFAGHSYAAVEKALGRTSAVLLVLILLGALVIWRRQHKRRRRSAATEEPRRPAEG